MLSQKLQFYFLIMLLGLALGLTFFIFRPFLQVLVLAAVVAVACQPLHRRLLRRSGHRRGLAALGTTLIMVAFMVLPLIWLGVQISQEARQLYASLAAGNGQETALNIFQSLTEKFPINTDQYLKSGLSWLLQNLGTIFSNFAKILINSGVFILALYYFLKEGPRLKQRVVDLSPLVDADDESILKKLELAVNSVVRGSLMIALIQGVLTAVGFAIFGVPQAVLWGTVAAICALIPGIGTALVLVPGIIFLFLTGPLMPALGLLAWGLIAVGLIDNLLGPKLVGRGMQLSPVLVFLAVFGGIGFFGPMGFLLGPLTLSLLFALLDIYSESSGLTGDRTRASAMRMPRNTTLL